MSWWRSAVTKAVEAGGKNTLTRTVRNYADSVVQHAGQVVVEGAKIFQDRIGNQNFQSLKLTVKRLEELSVSCKGQERIQLLRRWLVALKDIKRLSEVSFDKDTILEQKNVSNESKDSPRKPSMVLYYDPDMGGEPMNFQDVFLQSQALEGIIMSMPTRESLAKLEEETKEIHILEAPDNEEISLLSEIFGVCFTGGKEVHNAILNSLQDLAKAFLFYQDEVLVKREELLQLAQTAVSGLKLNADCSRIDAEVSFLRQKLDGMEASRPKSEGQGKSAEKTTTATIEALKEALAEVQVCSKLESLLLKKKSLKIGDSPETHSQKIDKMKILTESLASSTLKAEKRITDQRLQKEEALKFRLAKSNECSELEKELSSEVSELEKQRDELEAELKKVNTTLVSTRARLRNTREEREQFDEASNQIVAHLKIKEDELASSVAQCRREADVVTTWIKFLEDAWVLQSSYIEQKNKQAKDELEKYGDHFVYLVIHHVSAYKEELGPSISHIKDSAEKLRNLTEGSPTPQSDSGNQNPRKNLEEEYVHSESKILTTLGVVDNIKEQFYAQHENISRRDESKVKELFDAIEKLKNEFESIERPTLEMNSSRAETPTSARFPMSPLPLSHLVESETPKKETPKKETPKKDTPKKDGSPKATLNTNVELALNQSGSVHGEGSKGQSTEEIADWEFD